MSFWDRIKIAWAGVALIGVGLFLYLAPGDIAADIDSDTPYREAFAIAFGAMGALMLLALVFTRVKALLLTLLSGVMAAGCGFVAVEAGLDSVRGIVFAVFALGVGLFAVFCFISIFTGDDPAG